jgi:anti-sigma B factor antagonist
MSLKVKVEPRAGGAYVIVEPAGPIDATTYTVLAAEVEALLKKPPPLLIFDLQYVNFVSSAGIGVVLSTEKAMKKAGGKTLIVNAKPHVRKVFDIVQALPKDQLFNSVQELDAYLAEIQRQVREGPST